MAQDEDPPPVPETPRTRTTVIVITLSPWIPTTSRRGKRPFIRGIRVWGMTNDREDTGSLTTTGKS